MLWNIPSTKTSSTFVRPRPPNCYLCVRNLLCHVLLSFLFPHLLQATYVYIMEMLHTYTLSVYSKCFFFVETVWSDALRGRVLPYDVVCRSPSNQTSVSPHPRHRKNVTCASERVFVQPIRLFTSLNTPLGSPNTGAPRAAAMRYWQQPHVTDRAHPDRQSEAFLTFLSQP